MKFYLKTKRYFDCGMIFQMRLSFFGTMLLCRNALVGIIKKGGLPSLYAGWGAVLCRNVPHSIIKVRVILDACDLSSIETTVSDQFCHSLIFFQLVLFQSSLLQQVIFVVIILKILLITRSFTHMKAWSNWCCHHCSLMPNPTHYRRFASFPPLFLCTFKSIGVFWLFFFFFW